MKIKLLTLTAIVTCFLTIGSAANAATCEGGSLITGANGHEYCQSNNTTNWWSAFTWCEAQGRHLATVYEACPEWDGATGQSKCMNMSANPTRCTTYRAWSATANGSVNAFAIGTYSCRQVETFNRNQTWNALCY